MIPVASLFLTMLQFLHHHQIADHEIGNMHPPSKSHAVGNFFTIHYNSRFFFLCYFRQKIEENLTLCGIPTKQPRSIPSPFIHLWKEPLHHFTPYSLFTLLCPFYLMSLDCVTRSPLSLSTTGNNSIPTLTSIILPPPPFIHLRSRIHLFPIRNYLLFTMPVCNQQSNRE